MRQTTIAILLAASAGLGACATVNEGVRRVTGRSAVVTAPVCRDFTFPLYFQEGSDQLTRDGLQVIDNYSAQARACPVAQVQVTGLADAGGGDAVSNLQLSQRRATVVAQALSARGYPTPKFEVEAAGSAGAVTSSGRAEPLRRRAEVSVRFAAATPAP